METKLITWNEMKEAVEALKDGQVVAFPTETVYGLGAIANSEAAFQRLVEAKHRPENKPFTMMVSSYGDIAQYAEVDAKSIAIIQKFMPGPLTVLLRARQGIPHYLDYGTGIIGVRFPAHLELLALIDAVGCPLLVPSANHSGDAPCRSERELLASFKGEIPLIIGDGKIKGEPSTIVDLSEPGKISLVREGVLPFAELEEAFASVKGLKIAFACDHGGFKLKEKAKGHIAAIGYEVVDYGTSDERSCDYPLFAKEAAKGVASGKEDLGFLFCTSGEGVAIAANKVPGIRCGIGYDDVATGKNREHNHANMIAFGQKYMKEEDVLRRLDIFLIEKPSALAKHVRRVNQLEE